MDAQKVLPYRYDKNGKKKIVVLYKIDEKYDESENVSNLI